MMDSPVIQSGVFSENKKRTLANSCISLLQQTQQNLMLHGMPADRFLAGVFRSCKKYGSRDRAAIQTCIFSWFRWYGWIQKAIPQDTPLEFKLAAAIAAEGMPLPVFDIWAPDTPPDIFQPGDPLTRFEAFLGKKTDCTLLDLIPQWTLERLPDRADFQQKYLKMLQNRPPLWLRVQNMDPELIRKSLAEQGFESRRHPVLPNAIEVCSSRNVNLNGWNLFRNGKVEVQDLSSQCIGFCSGANPGEHWLDLCAGGGGKSLQLALFVGKKGSVTASDIRLFKLEHLKERATRAGLSNILCAEKKTALSNSYDGVLVDAPCSSSGRWRRNPEMRWVASEQWLRELNQVQSQVLEEGASAVRPGGLLVYATCSIFPCENTLLIQAFLEKHPEFVLEPFSNPHNGSMTDGTLATLPGDGNCDGSFVARMRRKGSA